MRSVRILAPAAVLALLLAGCGPLSTDPVSTPSSTPSVSTPSPTASATPSPTEAPAPEGDPVPIEGGCEQLVSLDQMYDYSPSFALLGAAEPAAGSPAAGVLSAGGLACAWTHESNGQTITVAAARPGAQAEAARTAAAAGSAVDADTYYSVVDGAGTVQAFRGDLWIVVASPLFGGAEDARGLVDDIAANLG